MMAEEEIFLMPGEQYPQWCGVLVAGLMLFLRNLNLYQANAAVDRSSDRGRSFVGGRGRYIPSVLQRAEMHPTRCIVTSVLARGERNGEIGKVFGHWRRFDRRAPVGQRCPRGNVIHDAVQSELRCRLTARDSIDAGDTGN
jgi:hypothetical protein